MEKVQKSVIIHAPIDTIFNYIGEPTNLLKIWPSMIEIQDVQRLHNGDLRFRCVHKMAGARIESVWEAVEYIVNQRITAKISGGIRSEITWMFEPQIDGTKVTFIMGYGIPSPLLHKHSEASITTWNEHEAEATLANLKTEMEARNPSPVDVAENVN